MFRKPKSFNHQVHKDLRKEHKVKRLSFSTLSSLF